ncbi:MAG: bifunctional pyr operon transcriptional regulator/uracil phosphoribosyltransferase PyrR [Flavobacteriaceae bacterium]
MILKRLASQLIEKFNDFDQVVLVGLQPRGIHLLHRLVELLENDYGLNKVINGKLDITFFRDDFRRSENPLKANSTQIDFLVEDRNVIFIDDVLYSGRSVQAALSAIQSFGRPKAVELMVLIDRRFSRHLPIQPSYTGRQVDAISEEHVRVAWKEKDGEDCVYLVKNKI